MSKIPVGRTISQTYGFAIGWFFPILGVVWLPFLILGLVAYFYFFPALVAMTDASQQMVQQMAQHNAESAVLVRAHMGQFLGRIYAFNLVTLIVFSVIAVGISKEALGLRPRPRFVYLDLGKRELLVMAGFFVVFVLFYIAIMAAAILGGIVGGIVLATQAGASGGHIDPATMGASLAKVIIPVVALFELVSIYFVTRLTYLMVPITTAEGRFGVWQSWRMTRGNFWRIVGVALATLLPLLILQLAVSAAIFGTGFFQSMIASQMHPLTPNPQLSVLMHKMVQYSIYGWVVGIVIAPLTYGLTFGQASFAYRALTPPAAE